MTHIHKEAKIGKNCILGHGVVIDQNVTIGDNNVIGNHVVITGNVKIGNGNFLSDFISIGRPSCHQIEKYEFKQPQKGEITIGDNNVFRESVTINLPTKNITKIGNNSFLMPYCHISHDVTISNDVVFANSIQTGGFTYIGKNSFLGLSTTTHQLSSIGAFCMIGMQSNITTDIPPGMLAYGNPVECIKIDKTGLLKKGFNLNDVEEITLFYESSATRLEAKQNVDKITSKLFREAFLEFIYNSKRKISLPNNRSWHI